MNLTNKLKVGVVGVGRLGSIHARVYSELNNVDFLGVCDTNHYSANSIAKEYKVLSFYDYQAMIPHCDIVSIATPTISHYDIAKYAILNKKNVLIEKPITDDVKKARELLSLARRNRVVLQVGHVERFNSAFIAIQKMFLHPRFIECHRLGQFPNRSLDVGVVFDLMIHDIDIILGIVKSGVRRVEASGVKIITNFEDIANARLTFNNGCIANITASRVATENMRKIRIFLKDTYISLDYRNQEAFYCKKVDGVIIRRDIPIEKEESIKKELESFVNCVRYCKKPIVSGVEAIQALEIATKIRDLINEKKD